MAAPTGATAKLLTMLCWVRVVAQIEVLQRLALTKSLCQSYSKSPETKKSVRIATFLRLAIAASSSIANRGTKTQQKWHISSLKEPRRAPNRKKVAKIPSFLFFAMGPIAATGQIPRKCAEHHGQQPKIRNKKGARHADASKKPNRLKSTLPWHHTARNKHRVQPSTYRRSPLRPELRGCTGAR